MLQYAKEVLTDPAKKADYDKWRKSGIAIPYKDWLAKKDAIHTVCSISSKILQQNLLIHDGSNFCSLMITLLDKIRFTVFLELSII